ncbi:hepatocyte growth factor receptor-like [Saccoglossus kowalevskii]
MEGSTVGFVAPGYDDKPMLYTGTSRRGNLYGDEAVSGRQLEGNLFSIISSYSRTAIHIISPYQRPNNVIYITGFSYGGFSYFLTVQRLGRSDNSYISRIVRVCQERNPYYYGSYTEVTLQCYGSDGMSYNLLQAAHVTKPASDIAISLSLADGEHVLFAVFAKGETPQDLTPLQQSAVCLYKMTDIEQAFSDAIFGCINQGGNDFKLDYISGSACLGITGPVEECSTGGLYRYANGKDPLSIYAILEYPNTLLTSIGVTTVQEHTVGFIGTQDGHLLKVHFRESLSAAQYYVHYLHSSTVMPDITFDNNFHHVYVLAKHKNIFGSNGRRGRHYCPYIEQQNDEVLVHVGMTISLVVNAVNMPDLKGNPGYECILRGYGFEDSTPVTLYDCSVSLDCSECLSTVTSREELQCGWCVSDNSCQIEQHCDYVWLPQDTTHNCGDPVIYEVWPSSGSFEGGTDIVIGGSNLGKTYFHIYNVHIGGRNCILVEERYTVSRSIECTTDSADVDMSGQISVIIIGNDGTPQTGISGSSIQFTWRKQVPNDFIPKIGPKAGGTRIVITGKYMNAGRNITAFIDGSLCTVKRLQEPCEVLSDTSMICITPSVPYPPPTQSTEANELSQSKRSACGGTCEDVTIGFIMDDITGIKIQDGKLVVGLTL